MRLIRTFHPIGQGAFYTERHNFNGIEFTMVYDCGSTTLTKNDLEKRIKSTFPKDHVIDILFISHFHADHINGITMLSRHCKIKTVVLPLIDDEAKILLKIENIINDDFFDPTLIDNPEDFFGANTSIIKIRSTELDENYNPPEGSIDMANIKNSSIEGSGTIFSAFIGTDWFFIPYNYKYTARKMQFIDALKSYKLTLVDVNTIDKINKNIKEIRKAYIDIDGTLNQNSMILYSGSNITDTIRCFNHNHHRYYLGGFFHSRHQSACLYMGDIELNEPGIVADIQSKLRNFLPFIGTLQVPHHGSINNFATSILESSMGCAIFSFGKENKYGHPSDRVVADVIVNDIYPHLITEEKDSIVVQWK